jgi:hypothetical protein
LSNLRQFSGNVSNIEQWLAVERAMLDSSQPSNRLLSAVGGATCWIQGAERM